MQEVCLSGVSRCDVGKEVVTSPRHSTLLIQFNFFMISIILVSNRYIQYDTRFELLSVFSSEIDWHSL